jgi:hypothetical protein
MSLAQNFLETVHREKCMMRFTGKPDATETGKSGLGRDGWKSASCWEGNSLAVYSTLPHSQVAFLSGDSIHRLVVSAQMAKWQKLRLELCRRVCDAGNA